MLVKNIFMELRSRLRSCNVYITTGVDFSKNCNLKISIQSNCIVLNYIDDVQSEKSRRRDSLSSIESLLSDYSEDESEIAVVIPIEKYYSIVPNSMSCLKIEKNTISFRILTEPKNGGNFYTEVIQTDASVSTFNVKHLKVNVKVDNEVKIVCSNCSNEVSEGIVKFGRVLELPSDNMDMSEWFCHGHGHSHGQNEIPPPTKEILTPSKHDFLYRLTFFVVNNNILSEKTNKFNAKRDIYHCNRCLAWLGLKNKNTVKLFNSEVKIIQNNIENTAFTHSNRVDKISLNDFIYTIEKMAKEFNLGMQYNIMFKIVLECSISATQKQFLLIWVIDKELQVLRGSIEQIENKKVILQSCLLSKVLYKVEFSVNEEVESWLADPMVVTTDISKSMFTQGLEHLQSMAQKIPECFRNTNGYFITSCYLGYFEHSYFRKKRHEDHSYRKSLPKDMPSSSSAVEHIPVPNFCTQPGEGKREFYPERGIFFHRIPANEERRALWNFLES